MFFFVFEENNFFAFSTKILKIIGYWLLECMRRSLNWIGIESFVDKMWAAGLLHWELPPQKMLASRKYYQVDFRIHWYHFFLQLCFPLENISKRQIPFLKCTILGEIPHHDSFPTFSRIYIYRTRMQAKIILFISNIFCGVVELICRKQQISSSMTKPLLFGQNSILRRHQRPQSKRYWQVS